MGKKKKNKNNKNNKNKKNRISNELINKALKLAVFAVLMYLSSNGYLDKVQYQSIALLIKFFN